LDDLNIQEREAMLQIDSDLIATEKALIQANKKLENARAAYPYNTQDIIQCKKQVEALENGIKELKQLKAESF
jgi:hypothetical protein